jgi:hypothetical protein
MNEEQKLALGHARLTVENGAPTEMIRQLVSIIDDYERLDEERRRALNEITTSRDELREQHAHCIADGISEARKGRFEVTRPPDTQKRREPIVAPTYLEQARFAGEQLSAWLEQARRAGFYTELSTPDAVHFDVDFTPRDTSNDPEWEWGSPPEPDAAQQLFGPIGRDERPPTKWKQHPETGMVQRVVPDPREIPVGPWGQYTREEVEAHAAELDAERGSESWGEPATTSDEYTFVTCTNSNRIDRHRQCGAPECTCMCHTRTTE